MSRANWIDVDLDGLAKTLARRGKGWILRELVQNAIDEDVTRVDITFEPIENRPLCRISVEDDCPTGFAKLSDAWTLFGESKKKGDPTKAGRFLAGEKFVLAFCEEATISSTTGTVIFGREKGRVLYSAARFRRPAGSKFEGVLRITRDEVAELVDAAHTIIPPVGVTITVNGAVLDHRLPVMDFDAFLETEVADANGMLKRDWRDTTVHLYEPLPGTEATLFELGLPVVVTGDKWDIDIRQKVPLTLERDNVKPRFLQEVRTAVLNNMADQLTTADVTEAWVRDAVGDSDASDDAIKAVTQKRFGDKVVAYDMSDPEANKLAVAQGYVVVHGGSLSADEWENVKRVNIIPAAGQITPSPKAFSPDGSPLEVVAPDTWPEAWHKFDEYARGISLALLGRKITLVIANDRGWPHRAACGTNHVLYWNVATEGKAFFDAGPTEKINALLIHEFAHAAGASDHLSAEFYRTLCDLGAKFVRAVMANPALVRNFWTAPFDHLRVRTHENGDTEYSRSDR
jgi:hypothetical protein